LHALTVTVFAADTNIAGTQLAGKAEGISGLIAFPVCAPVKVNVPVPHPPSLIEVNVIDPLPWNVPTWISAPYVATAGVSGPPEELKIRTSIVLAAETNTVGVNPLASTGRMGLTAEPVAVPVRVKV
jgi:hypothetical protein